MSTCRSMRRRRRTWHRFLSPKNRTPDVRWNDRQVDPTYQIQAHKGSRLGHKSLCGARNSPPKTHGRHNTGYEDRHGGHHRSTLARGGTEESREGHQFDVHLPQQNRPISCTGRPDTGKGPRTLASSLSMTFGEDGNDRRRRIGNRVSHSGIVLAGWSCT